MSFTLKVLGEQLSGKWPSLSLIEAAIGQDPEKLKALAKATFPGLSDLLKAQKKAAAYPKVGLTVLALSGAVGPLKVIEEDDLEDGDPAAKAWADAQKKFEDTEIHLIQFERKAPHYAARFLVREPREREIDAYLKVETFEASREFVRKLCVWGDSGDKPIDDLADNAPALPRAISMFILEKAGLHAEIELGEA